ncbi:MAG: 2,3-bisphosphoglycerate-independent phosphoglycerate mutase [Rhodospirillales bacterium]
MESLGMTLASGNEKGRGRPRPVVLCILDGWGQAEAAADNAIALAETPYLDGLFATRPKALIEASELHVGLPSGQMGNSEVGHMNLGAGRVVMQDLPRIDQALADGSLAESPELADFIAALKASGGRAHLLGLLSPGGVHAHQDHLAGLAEILRGAGIEVLVHAVLDGRDTPPKSAGAYLKAFAAKTGAPLASLCGRFYAMDRDQRWDRVSRAYSCLVAGEGERAVDAEAALQLAYERGESDEFVAPSPLGDYAGMQDGDGLVMGNFRADRAREILSALVDPDFDGFRRDRPVAFAACLGMVSYSGDLDRFLPALFPPNDIAETLGELVSAQGWRQLRIAETEKYAHVTFFFNGGREEVFAGEERVLVPSPDVATYDLQPEMAAGEVTDRLVAAIAAGTFDLIVVNYANGDMVGHTGDIDAAVKAAETVDACLARLGQAVEAAGGALLVTADHGNAEQMRDAETGQAHTAHTMNPVPILLACGPDRWAGLQNGRLADVAPTLLDLLGLPQPDAMTGRSLLRDTAAATEAA